MRKYLWKVTLKEISLFGSETVSYIQTRGKKLVGCTEDVAREHWTPAEDWCPDGRAGVLSEEEFEKKAEDISHPEYYEVEVMDWEGNSIDSWSWNYLDGEMFWVEKPSSYTLLRLFRSFNFEKAEEIIEKGEKLEGFVGGVQLFANL